MVGHDHVSLNLSVFETLRDGERQIELYNVNLCFIFTVQSCCEFLQLPNKMRRKTLQIAGGIAAASALILTPKFIFKKYEEKSAKGTEVRIQPPDPSGVPWDNNWDR